MTVSETEYEEEDKLVLSQLLHDDADTPRTGSPTISTAQTSPFDSPASEEQQQFDELSTTTKLSKLDSLVKKSQVYSSIIAENLLANVQQKKESSTRSLQLQQHRQPKLLSGAEMRDYQLEGLDFLVSLYENGLNGILADEMGLGKTIQCISFLTFLIGQGITGPFLVVVPLSTVGNWKNEFAKFAPKVKVLLYIGSKDTREEIRTASNSATPKSKKRGRPRKTAAPGVFDGVNVVLTSYEISIKDHAFLKGVDWKFLIVDEGHRLKNSKCLLIQKLKELNVSNRLLITGTPLQNNLNELWSLLNFILPDIFHDLELFQQWFNFDELTQLKNQHKKQDSKVNEFENKLIELNIQKSLIESLHTILKPFILRRLKKDVITWLPPKKEYIVFVSLSDKQKRLYKECLGGRLFEVLFEEYFTDYIEANYGGKAVNTTEPIIERQGKDLESVLAPKSAMELLMAGSRAAKPKTNLRAKRSRPTNAAPVGRLSSSRTAKSISLSFTTEDITNFLAAKFKPKLLSTKRRKISRKDTLQEEDSDQEFETHDPEEEEEGVYGSDDAVIPYSVEDLERKLTDFKHINSLAVEERKAYVLNTLYLKVSKDLRNRSLQNMLMQLRNICNSPYIYYEPFPTAVGTETEKNIDREAAFMSLLMSHSAKLQVLSQLTKALIPRGHKILIFSQFTRMLDLLSDYFHHEGTAVCRLDGSSSQADRQETIDSFNTTHGAPIFLLSTRAGGLGINLTTADTVILFDSDWNPQIDLQAIDRAHRIGQTRPVKIYRFVMRDSIEEVLLYKSYSKIFLNKLIIQMNEHKSKSMEKLQEAAAAAAATTSGSGAMKESDELVSNLKALIDLPKSFNHNFAQGKDAATEKTLSSILTEEEMDELLDRSESCYKRTTSKFKNITVFETVNNMEQ